MKKKSLFLSIVCSVLLTIALVTVTVVNFVAPKSNGGTSPTPVEPVTPVDIDPVDEKVKEYIEHNETADGSEENAYYVYDVETFTNLLNAHGTENAYFEVKEDIDFAGVNYVTMFNNEAFNGTINSGEKVLSNININVNANYNSIKAFAYKANEEYYVNVALFGKVDGAKLQLNIRGLSITFAEGINDYITGKVYTTEGFVFDEFVSIKQVVVAGVVGESSNSDIQVNLEATINADAYARATKVDNGNGTETITFVGDNRMGGVVATAVNTEIHDSTVNVKMNLETSNRAYVGGVVGDATNVSVNDVNVELTLKSDYEQVLKVGGVAGYANAFTAKNVNVKVVAREANDRVAVYDELNDAYVSSFAGVVNYLETSGTITNVNVKLDVEQDVVLTGVALRVVSSDVSKATVHFEIVDAKVETTSNTNVLKLYGIAKELKNALVTFTDSEVVYLTLDGTILLEATHLSNGNIAVGASPVSLIARNSNKLYNQTTHALETVYTVSRQPLARVSSSVWNKLPTADANRLYVEII